MKRLAPLFLCILALTLSAQTPLTADGLAAFGTNAPSGGGGGGDITTGLVARWKFDEGTGTSAADATGNGHTGTLNGSPTWSAGHIGANAISYPGTSGSGVSFSAIATGTTFTYAAWINHDSSGAGSYQNLMTESSSTGFWLVFDGTGYRVDYYYGGDHFGTTYITASTWHHIAVVNNAGSWTMYLDGAVDKTGTLGTSFNANGMGADGGNGGEPFAGDHDDVRFYSRALSAGDITTLYNFTGP